MKRLIPLLLVATWATGCGHPKHLQYDFGRSYTEVMVMQADLDRPSVADSQYQLSGFEGIELRQRVSEQATDEESGEAEAVKKFEVQ